MKMGIATKFLFKQLAIYGGRQSFPVKYTNVTGNDYFDHNIDVELITCK